MSAKTVMQRNRHINTPAENESLRDRISAHMEDTAESKNPGLYNPGSQQSSDNTSFADASIKRQQAVLRNGQPDTLSRYDRALVEKSANQDKEWLQKSMVPKSHVYLRPGGPDQIEFRKAVNEMATKENSSKFQQVAERWKNKQRQLGRESNLEAIRPSSR